MATAKDQEVMEVSGADVSRNMAVVMITAVEMTMRGVVATVDLKKRVNSVVVAGAQTTTTTRAGAEMDMATKSQDVIKAMNMEAGEAMADRVESDITKVVGTEEEGKEAMVDKGNGTEEEGKEAMVDKEGNGTTKVEGTEEEGKVMTISMASWTTHNSTPALRVTGPCLATR